MIPTLLLLGVMIFFFVYMMKQTGSGGKIGQFGKSNAKIISTLGKKATFADVAGADEEKKSLRKLSISLKTLRNITKLVQEFKKEFYYLDLLVQVRHC